MPNIRNILQILHFRSFWLQVFSFQFLVASVKPSVAFMSAVSSSAAAEKGEGRKQSSSRLLKITS